MFGGWLWHMLSTSNLHLKYWPFALWAFFLNTWCFMICGGMLTCFFAIYTHWLFVGARCFSRSFLQIKGFCRCSFGWWLAFPATAAPWRGRIHCFSSKETKGTFILPYHSCNTYVGGLKIKQQSASSISFPAKCKGRTTIIFLFIIIKFGCENTFLGTSSYWCLNKIQYSFKFLWSLCYWCCSDRSCLLALKQALPHLTYVC